MTLTPPLCEADIGRKFETRSGKIVTGEKYDPCGEDFRRFCADGEWYYDDGSFYMSKENPFDLIRRIPDEPALTREAVEAFVASEGGTVTWPGPSYDEERELLARLAEAAGWLRLARIVRDSCNDHHLPAIAKILNEWKEKQG